MIKSTGRAARAAAAIMLMLGASAPLAAQRADGLRAGVQMAAPRAGFSALPEAVLANEGVTRRKLAIGAGVGAVIGGVAGGVWVNNSGLGKNEAWPLFVGGGAVIGALIGAGLGMAVTGFILP